MRQALMVSLLFGVTACGGPMGPIPGGELPGEVVAWPQDWLFTNEIENFLLETNPNDPYSVTIWAVTTGDVLYFVGVSGDSTWVTNILGDNRVRLAVNDHLYAARAAPVSDPAELDAVRAAYVSKYDLGEEDTEPVARRRCGVSFSAPLNARLADLGQCGHLRLGCY